MNLKSIVLLIALSPGWACWGNLDAKADVNPTGVDPAPSPAQAPPARAMTPADITRALSAAMTNSYPAIKQYNALVDEINVLYDRYLELAQRVQALQQKIAGTEVEGERSDFMYAQNDVKRQMNARILEMVGTAQKATPLAIQVRQARFFSYLYQDGARTRAFGVLRNYPNLNPDLRYVALLAAVPVTVWDDPLVKDAVISDLTNHLGALQQQIAATRDPSDDAISKMQASLEDKDGQLATLKAQVDQYRKILNVAKIAFPGDEETVADAQPGSPSVTPPGGDPAAPAPLPSTGLAEAAVPADGSAPAGPPLVVPGTIPMTRDETIAALKLSIARAQQEVAALPEQNSRRLAALKKQVQQEDAEIAGLTVLMDRCKQLLNPPAPVQPIIPAPGMKPAETAPTKPDAANPRINPAGTAPAVLPDVVKPVPGGDTGPAKPIVAGDVQAQPPVPAPTAKPMLSSAEVMTQIKRSIVLVMVENAQGASSGTGFVVGLKQVVTCAQLLKDAVRVVVRTPDGKRCGATIARTDLANGIVVLSCDGTLPQALEIAGSDGVHEGDEVAVTGYPPVEGIDDPTVTVMPTTSRGVAGVWRARHVEGGDMQECPIDASIKPGNSGGPVYRLSDGKVIGLAGWKTTTEQVENLAISIDGLKALPGQGNPATTVPVPVPAPAP